VPDATWVVYCQYWKNIGIMLCEYPYFNGNLQCARAKRRRVFPFSLNSSIEKPAPTSKCFASYTMPVVDVTDG
jgi:hypothetical protein